MADRPAFLIRAYRDDDAASVIALWRCIFVDPAPHNDPARIIEQKTAVDRELFFVAVADSILIGSVMGGYDGHRGWVYALAVAPEFRRRGVGRALMGHLEAALSRCGCLKINLQVRESSAAVVRFYEKLGYETEARVSMGKRLYD